MTRLLSSMRSWLARQEGSVTVEAVIMLPALVWCYLGTYVFFDAYRAQTVNVKAAYTIADTLTREQDYITDAYIDGLYDLQTFLVGDGVPASLRVSAIAYDGDADALEIRWSEGRGGPSGLTATELAAARPQIPVMADGDVAVVVEMWMDYAPPFAVGLGEYTYADLVVSRPRFTSRLCFNTVEGGDHTTAIC